MRSTLLELVQSILSDMDSEPVNSITDSVESLQVASVIEDTYYNLVSARTIPEHKELIKLVSLSDNTRPTHFKYVGKVIEFLRYNIDQDGGVDYREIKFVEPEVFLKRNSQGSGSTMLVSDVHAETNLVIGTDSMPSIYTSFDDQHVVMDSYVSTLESTLQASKTQAYGTVLPTFTLSDTFQIDIDEVLIPYLLAESKSACFSLFKAGSDPKVEQSARRLKSYVQNDMYRTKKSNKRPHYGRF